MTNPHGKGPVWRQFHELAHLPPDQRRSELMHRLEHVWSEAQARSYLNKHGDEIPNPDTAVMLKVVQAVAVLQGMTGPSAEAEAAKLGEMTDAELVREATKRLPAGEVAKLADALIEQREQQLSKRAIVTTGENADEQRSSGDPTEGAKGDIDRTEEPGSEWA